MKKRKGSNKKVKKITIILLIIVLISYISLIYKYKDTFYKSTNINEIDCSGLTINQVEKLLRKQAEQYTIEIKFKNNEKQVITGEQIGLKINNLKEELKQIKKKQLFSIPFINEEKYSLNNFSFSNKKLKKKLKKIEQLQEEYMEKNTIIKYEYSFESSSFEVTEYESYYIDFDKAFSKVKSAIKQGKDTISLKKLYTLPKDVLMLDTLNSYIKAKIIYTLPNQEEYILGADIIHTWLKKTENGYEKDEELWNENIQIFINELASKVNTAGTAREFKPTNKDTTVMVEGGYYGYLIDKKSEIETLKENLSEGKVIRREPIYIKKDISNDNYGIGYSYVEIDLTRQKVWVYIDGSLELETDCVTGCVNKGYSTPTGIFFLTYKTQNAVLRGNGYASPVNYWMPFNGNIGLHDANWRSKFGDDIYITNGSHGCINLPPKNAAKLYNLINNEMPIIVYKS